jgi:hypothetical protein
MSVSYHATQGQFKPRTDLEDVMQECIVSGGRQQVHKKARPWKEHQKKSRKKRENSREIRDKSHATLAEATYRS